MDTITSWSEHVSLLERDQQFFTFDVELTPWQFGGYYGRQHPLEVSLICSISGTISQESILVHLAYPLERSTRWAISGQTILGQKFEGILYWSHGNIQAEAKIIFIN